jgi:hypothetical protein
VKVVRRNGRAILELHGDTGHLTGGEKHADRLAPAPEDGRGGGVR